MNTRILALATLVAATLTLALGSRALEPSRDHSTRRVATAQDARTAIVLPRAARDAVLSEMRAMLRALHGVLSALEKGDRSAMRRAAASGGMQIAVDTDPSVHERLPREFVQLGVSTHRAFDELAAAIEAGADMDGVIGHLSGLTSKCVACHAGYRIDTE